jgi:DNA-directed RNA polymerase omega subunit
MKKPLQYGADTPAPYKKMVTDSFIAENVEESLKAFNGSRFSMIITASERARDLKKGALPFVKSTHKPCVTALLEIAAGKVKNTYTHKTR